MLDAAGVNTMITDLVRRCLTLRSRENVEGPLLKVQAVVIVLP